MDFAWMAFSQAWQVTALIVCVLLANRLFAKNRPHLAYGLWLVVLVKCVTPPLWSSPSSAFSWLQTAWTNNGQPVPVSHEPRPAVSFDLANDPVPYSDKVVLRLQPDVAPVDATQTVDAGRSHDAAALNGWLLLAAVWASGIGLAMLVSGYRWLTCIRKLRRSPSVESPELEALLARLARRLNVRRQVGLQITTSRVGPAVIGLLRPLIVLPQAVVRGKQPEALEAIVAHELIHVRRGDLWLGLLQVCAKAVWWFYPLVWWASRLSTREAERCCDEEVIGELGCDPKRYARSLLEVLELRRTLQPVPAFPGMKPVEVTSQRLERIMQLGQGCHKRTPRWCWAVMLLLAAAALPGAALIVGEDETETQDFLSRSPPQVEQTFQAAAAVDLTGDRGEEWPAKLVDRQSLVVASYMSEKVIAELTAELGGDEAAALQKFGNRLIAESRLSDQPIPLKDRVRIWDGTVTMAASPEEHQRLQTVIELLEKYGTAQIKFDICFVSVSEGVFQQKIKDWELTQLDLGHEGIGQQDRDRFADIDRPLPTETSKPRARTGVATTTNLPAIYKIVEAEEAERLLEELQEAKRTSILAAPKVTMFNGRSATIRDSVQQPFVVGVTAVGDEVRAAQPQIRVVETGKVVRLRPLLRDANKLWIDYDIEVSHIQKVSTTTVRVAGVREPVTLQSPEVFTARIESAVEFELGKTVLIGGLTAVPEKGRTDRLLVMISAQRIELASANAIHIEESSTGRLVFGSRVASDAGVLRALAAFDEQFDSHSHFIEPPTTKPAATSSMEDKLEQRGSIHVANGTLSMWIDEIQKVWDVHVVNEVADSEITLSGKFIDTPMKEVLAKVLPVEGCTFRQADQSLLVTRPGTRWEDIKDQGRNARNPSEEIARRLDRNISLDISETPLAEALKLIGRQVGIDIEVVQHELAAEGVSVDEPVTVRSANPFTARAALELLLERRNLQYEEVGEKLLVRGRFTEQRYHAVYNVADLLAEDLKSITPQDYQSGHKDLRRRNLDLLAAVIPQRVAGGSWSDEGGPGAIEVFSTNLTLVVSQTVTLQPSEEVFVGSGGSCLVRMNCSTAVTTVRIGS